MLYYRTENKMYNSRKELRRKLGWCNYDREWKAGNITFINDQEFKQAVNLSDNTKQ
jgi:hypothetical protein